MGRSELKQQMPCQGRGMRDCSHPSREKPPLLPWAVPAAGAEHRGSLGAPFAVPCHPKCHPHLKYPKCHERDQSGVAGRFASRQTEA